MNEKRSIMGACEFSILTLQDIKKQLLDLGNPRLEEIYAMCGITVALTARLLHICQDVFREAVQSGEADAKTDVLEIVSRLQAFGKGMVGDE